MILFHGTSELRAQLIIESGKIKSKNVNRIYNDNKYTTTTGYVYLTDQLYIALRYGRNTVNIEHNYFMGDFEHFGTKVVIFKVDIDPNLLEPDYDQLEIECALGKSLPTVSSFMESLNICKSVRVSKDLIVRKEVINYATVPFPIRSNPGGEIFFEAIRFKWNNEKISNILHWVKL
jgi:hypothetical protein